jgi:hypothetical protein
MIFSVVFSYIIDARLLFDFSKLKERKIEKKANNQSDK